MYVEYCDLGAILNVIYYTIMANFELSVKLILFLIKKELNYTIENNVLHLGLPKNKTSI